LKTVFEMVREFHVAMDVPHPEEPCVPPYERRRLREDLDEEEFNEASAERFPFAEEPTEEDPPVNIPKLAKELIDGIYVKIGELVEMGITPEAAQACFEEVHRSNMSKLGDDGKPLRREDGKVLKGPNYSPADLDNVLAVCNPRLEWCEDSLGYLASSEVFPGMSSFGFTKEHARANWIYSAKKWERKKGGGAK
jgi:predicted HAD superfamily Cof-like phosphohydrolase